MEDKKEPKKNIKVETTTDIHITIEDDDITAKQIIDYVNSLDGTRDY